MTANLNTWVRTPGILFTCFVIYQGIPVPSNPNPNLNLSLTLNPTPDQILVLTGMLYGRHTLPLWAVGVQSVLPAFNALYYNKQAADPYP